MTTNTFDESFEKVKSFTATFKTNGILYFSTDYQEAKPSAKAEQETKKAKQEEML